MILSKAVLYWFGIALLEMIHGIARAQFLAPRVGDFRSRQIAVFTGSLIIIIYTWTIFSRLGLESSSDALLVGMIWVTCMTLFEFSVGHYVFKFPWKWLLNDFNLLRGRLLALGMIVLGLAPWICGRGMGRW